jgi:hypothetical protein
MNGKQTIQVVAKVAPPLLLVTAIVAAFIELISDKKAAEPKPEIKAANAGTENSGKIGIIPGVCQSTAVQPKLEINFPTILTGKIPLPESPTTPKRKRINRKHMENIFQHVELTLTEAVSALKNLGFGKSAAYEALSADGQFSDWLQFAPDGMISWKY